MYKFLKKDSICEPPWEYDFLVNLPESEYPKYLAKIFNYRTGENLPLKYDFSGGVYFSTRRPGLGNWIIDKKKCKTFNQKIQWIKLYGVTDLMRRCTDKVLVRDYVAEKIGEDYLKPVLQIIPSLNFDCHVIARNNSTLGDEVIQGERSQKAVYKNSERKSNNELDCHVAIAPRNDGQLNDVSTYFDQIDFDKLPNSSRVDFSQPKQDVTTYYNQIDWDKLPNAFVIKCNHGCKWHYIIKDKEEFLNTKPLLELVKRNMTGWLEQDYSFWGGFELNYRGIEPKILIEPLMRDEINKEPIKINLYCFNGVPKVIIKFFDTNKMSIWNEKFDPMENIFNFSEEIIKNNVDDYIKQTFDLSIKLSKDFDFVRTDWMIFRYILKN